MKFRIFYAPQVFKTWEKVYVLTNDGKLYCEYLDHFNPSEIIQNNLDYTNFAPKSFSWGIGVEGDRGIAFTNFQGCEKELSWEEYVNLKPSLRLSGYDTTSIRSQIKWVQNYLSKLGINSANWDKETYEKFNKN